MNRLLRSVPAVRALRHSPLGRPGGLMPLALLALAALALALALAPTPGRAQPAPTLALAGSQYLLSVPYVEYGSGAARRAYSASLGASDLAAFVLDGASVQTVALVEGASDPARLDAEGGGYRLQLPYLEFASGGVTRAYAASLTSTDLLRFVVDAASVREVALEPALTAPQAVRVDAVDAQTVGSVAFASSTRLLVQWSAPARGAVDHFEVAASESVGGTRVAATAGAGATQLTLGGLKSATTYTVVVTASADAACTRAASATAVAAATAAEHWQLQGSGHSVAGLTQPVADGNARLSATRFGAEAGAVADTVQFYYGPKGVSGLAVAASGSVSAAVPASYLSFTSHAGRSGIGSPGQASSGIKSIMTGQGVPLAAALGARVRLFFESNDADGRTRIYSVDSVDGYVGRDFNQSAAATTCSSSADYAAGGPCAATLVIGVEGDGAAANARIRAARQHKLGYPSLADWRWDGAAGSFLVFTVDAIAGCTTATHNHAYAVWDGSRFVVQYAADGCPKLMRSVQAAVPMHLGGASYKLYYGDPAQTSGKLPGSTLPFVGPKRLVYADGARSGASTTVEFEDWEDVAQARALRFLWPDGTLLSDGAAGYIDDFHFLAPTGSLELQVAYLTITDGVVIPFAAAAVLLNP